MKPSNLSPLQHRILEKLSVLHFATPTQLGELCGGAQPNVSVALTALFNAGLIEGELFAKPRIYYISRAGANLLGVSPPSGRRLPSWSVMSHACHRNQVATAGISSGFCFLSRVALLKQGFNPGHGEHAASDDAGTAWFVLLDDFMMGSDRIARAWTRRHSPNKKYWPDPMGRTWREVVQKFLVVTTDEKQAARHRARILRDQLPAEVLTIKPLWRL